MENETSSGKVQRGDSSAQIATSGNNSADAMVHNKIIPVVINNNHTTSVASLALCYLSFLTRSYETEGNNEMIENKLQNFEDMLTSLIEKEEESNKKLIEILQQLK